MIGGYVFDTSAVVAWSRRTSIMVDALVWSAVADMLVLVVPATVAGAARAHLLGPGDREMWSALFDLEVTVTPPFGLAEARGVGFTIGARLDHTQTLQCARDRGWSVVTATPLSYSGTDVEVIEL